MNRVIYSSEATQPMAERDLDRILARSRANNAALGVTGVLIFTDGVFLQVLEGQEDAVLRLMGTIVCDRRHRCVTVLSAAPTDAPAFARWHMAYLGGTDDEMARWAGLAGTVSVNELLADLRENPTHVATFLTNIVEVLSVDPAT